ncbi:hybrid non-ribosomal peptide synthetase/type I polyketide synthase [Ruegeria marina]|uniref:Amino acid adenylation domain-containing protein n=1 Tax=Ruegeria marina TaxID=639004 RepID=A0A1G6IB91_9RHOB|nr:hybrid non-ribosomal peptide synthetase/type I polyketide synthase [Ruegeria marina]SDC03797.1 amino acid adenylation domain-containing protein [Ruegeria marina]
MIDTIERDDFSNLKYDPNSDLYSHFLRACALFPDNLALTGDGRRYSYAEMADAADRIAWHLIANGVKPGDNVALITDRTPESVLAMAGIMRAGGAYVPLDPAYDSKQLAYVIDDSRPSAILWDDPYLDLAESLTIQGTARLAIKDVLRKAPSATPDFPQRGGEDACYIMYTSGSTGKPKGVVLPHRAIARLGYDQPFDPFFPTDVCLANSTIACDGSTWEIWAPLLIGAAVVVVSQPKPALDVLARTIQQEKVTVAFFYTGLAHLMIEHHLDTLVGLRQFRAGGDVMSVPLTRRLMQANPRIAILNGYGPTENSVFTTMHLVTAADLDAGSIPIGVPTGHCECFVIDENHAVLGEGELGQLVAAGPSVALGYLNQPDRTAESFIEDPRPGKTGRVYLTGDLVRRRKDGVYEFHGRVDRQVKLGGRRIELDEIEHNLRALPMLVDAAVVLVTARTGEKRIASFLKPEGPMPEDHTVYIREVMRELGKVLPDGMLPRVNRVVADFPLTVNSKVDRKALLRLLETEDAPAQSPARPTFHSQRVKMTARQAEAIVARLWDEALGCGPVPDDMTFFEAGGTSLQLVDVHAALMKKLGTSFDITIMFEVPRLGALSAKLAQIVNESAPADPLLLTAATPRPAPGDRKETPADLPENAIAIVGMAARLPGVNSIPEFWEHLRKGTNLIRPFAPEELEDSFTATQRSGGNYVPVRPGLPDAGLFDAKFFSMYPREAAVTDPQARVFLEICYEALEDSGRDPLHMKVPVGVFAGCSMSTYLIHNLLGDRSQAEEFTSNYQTGKFAEMTGNLNDCLSTRVSYKLNLRGPAMTVQTACSTSLTAIAQAMLNLRSGQCDTALAGGVSITFPQRRGYLTQEGGLASDDGTCRPFDAEASGTVFSSGAGVVVLRRLKDAVADGDHIYAVIRGAGINNDGADKISYTAPSVSGQAAAIALAHKDADIAAGTVSYVECHGTATPLGDPIEISGLRQAFGNGLPEASCTLGSVKGNIGHMDAAAGVVSVIKTALMLTHRELPPVANFKTMNKNINLADTPFRIPTGLAPWDAPHPLRAGVSSFGVGGTNAHLIMEEAPRLPAVEEPETVQAIVLSAKTPEALSEMQGRLADTLEAENPPSLADAAFTLQEGRATFEYRTSVAGKDHASIASALRGAAVPRKPALAGNPPVSFMFPGQGSQYPGMGSGLYSSEPEFARWIDAGAEILRPILGLDVKTMLCFGDPSDESAARALRETRLTQPALFLTQFACAKLWMARGVHPKAMIGHSVGEFTAAALAGVMDFETGLGIIAQRGELMQSQPGGAMLSVRAPLDALTPHLDGSVDIAARNAPQLNVLAGGFDAIDRMEGRLKAAGIACSRLHTSHAFHSNMMDPVCSALATALSGVRLNPAGIPYVSCVTGKWITDAECTDPSYWAHQARATVNFQDAVSTLTAETPAILLEVGAGNTLSAFARQTLPRDAEVAIVQSLPDHTRTESDDISMAKGFGQIWCAGGQVDWRKLGPRGTRRVPLPTYAFQRKLHWIEPPRPGAEAVTEQSVPDAALPASAIATTQSISSEVPPMATAAPAPAPTADRKPRLAAELLAMLSDISGEDLSPEDADVSFLDLGFDSLFLGQVSQKLTADYGVDLTFRQLLANYPTTNAVAAYLDENLPPEPAAVAEAAQPVAQPAQQAPLPEQAGVAVPAPAATSTPLPADGSVASLMQMQLATMQQIISQQISALSGGVQATVSPAQFAASPTPAQPAAAPAAMPAAIPAPAQQQDQAPEESAQDKPAPKRVFSIGRATNAAGGDLTPEQLVFAQDLARRYSERSPKSKAYVQKYRHVLADPRTASGFRAEWKELVFPVVCERSKGARLWDIDGNEYIDLVNGFGQTAFGHSPDFLIEAITRQMERGFAIGPQSDNAGPVAERFARFVGHERATFCNTGSEAVMAAMRVARTVTGREKIVVFSNDYHGQFDEVLVKGKKGTGEPAALPIAPGIPRSSLSNMVVLPYDSQASLDWIRANIASVAGVVVEPVQSRHPDLRPRDFVLALREITRDGGAALVFDEVVTGFRVGPRGMQGVWDIQGDMATYGKVVGGGMPIGMLAGSARFMDALDGGMWQFGDDSVPEAMPTFFAGTFVRHPLVVAAVDATLEYLENHGDALWTETANRTAEAVAKMNAVLAARGLPAMIETYSSWFVPHVTDHDANAALLFPLMRSAGIHVQIGYPCIFTTAHAPADYQRVVEVFEQSIDALRSVGILASGQPSETATVARPAAMAPVQRETPPTTDIPLTEAQREIWMTSQQGAAASCSFNESASFDLRGPLDTKALQTAFDTLIARHDGLRQVFARNGETFDILEPFTLPLALHDLSGEDDPEAALRQLLEEDSATEIDIVSGPPFRAFLVRRSVEDHVLVINAHHIVCDGWSYNVLSRELAALYRQEVDGTPANLPPAPSFAALAKRKSGVEPSVETRDFWRAQYADVPDLPELPTDRPRPALKTYHGATCTAHIPGDVMRAARKAGASLGCTLFTTLFAGLQIVMSRLSGSDDIVLGVPTGGQALLENSDMVGHCVNFLPIRAKQTEGGSIADHLSHVSDQVMNAFDHQDYTYGTLVRDLNVERSLNRLPLTEIQFNLERLSESVEMGPVRMTVAPNPKTAVNFDLFFNIVERRDGLRVDVDYNSDVFDAETVQRWIGHLETVLSEIAADTGRPLADLSVLTADQAAWIAEATNRTTQDLPTVQTVHQLIGQRTAERPDKVALECGVQQMTYRQLAERSDAMAKAIQDLDLAPGGRIAVALPRSTDCVAALLGVMKSGNAYVPIDPSQPMARLRMILENADVSGIVHDQPGMPEFAAGLDLPAIPLHSLDTGGAPAPVKVGGDATAYVMFTSGSTGTPKGVEISHRSVVNLLTSMAREPGFGQNDVLLAVTTTMFDISVLEIFLPLIQGGRTVIASHEDVLDGFRLVNRLKMGDITHMQATPTLWQMMLEAGFTPTPGFTMLAGGEPLPADLAGKLTAGGGAVWNVYGPTETTIWSAIARIEPEAPVTIGHPIANTSLHVLDPQNRLLPIGAIGELNIGGAGLAKGYFRRPDLTAEAFRQVTVNGKTETLYKTGDLARRLPDGSIQVLGRNDGQIKLRGFRIELGEVEAALRAHANVKLAAVALKPSPRGDQQLVGYVVAEAGRDPGPDALAQYLSERLPGYMVPSAWVFLSTLPQTANGKLDRKALPDPEVSATVTALHTDPKTPTETKMAEIWREVLGLDKVSTSQTLFSLGADSLTVFRIAARLIDAGLNLEARHLLQYPSIARLAAFADSNEGETGGPKKPSLKSYRRTARPAAN